MTNAPSFDPLSLEFEAILAEAVEVAGSDDFGDDAFREPMRRLLLALESEARLSDVGRGMQHARIVGLLVNRLRTEAVISQHPEILEEEIRAPLVIVGLARTGTTMLQRMIAADPQSIALAWWESRNPAPFPGWEEGLARGERDARIADAEAEVDAMIEGAPELVAMHPIEAEAPDEEIMLLEHAFMSGNAEAFSSIPLYSAWLAGQDHAPAYRHLKRLLQFVQWQKRRAAAPNPIGTRWALKTPDHLGHVDLLFGVFPGARVIQTHRDPLETIPSLASLIHAIRRLGCEDPDPHETGRQWSEKMSRVLDRCIAVRRDFEDRFIDVQFRDVGRDPLAEVRRIYAFAGLPLRPEAERAMRQWSVDNARDKREAHHYTLEEFGLSRESIERDFATYRERFIL